MTKKETKVIKSQFESFEEKKSYLDNLFYNIGKQTYDFDLFFMDKVTDKKSKWRKWSDVGFNFENESNKKFIENANNRTILGNEIVLDLEDPKKFNKIVKQLNKEDLFYKAYKTGSRGYHFTLIYDTKLNPEEKTEIIKRYGCDTQKASERCGIALEFTPHWKTGKPKELIIEKDGINKFIGKEELVKKIIQEGKEKEFSGETYEKLDNQTKNNLAILDSGEIHFENLNQGEFKKEWYFGKLFPKNKEEFKEGIILGKNMLLNNIQQMKIGQRIVPMGENEIKDVGLNYKHKLEPQNNFWSNAGEYSIKEFIKSENKKIVDKEEYYKSIYNKIDCFMDVKDKEIIDVATCWIIGSYCYELFETYGYLYFKALRDSGKSKFKKILRLIGFNGQEASSITEASFFRTIENTKGVLCLDEYEKMDSERKKATDLLLNAGIEKGSSVKRYDIDLKTNLNFDVYCPKIICNISGLNPTTMSRCIVVELVRTTTKKGKLKPRIKDFEWQLLRNMSYCFVMENWEEIKQIYENFDYSQINNRAEDLWRPILSIAKVFGDGKEINLKNYCERITKKLKEDEIEDDIDYLILSGLTSLVTEEKKFISSKEIADFLRAEGEINFGDKNPERVIGWHLRNFNIFEHKINRMGSRVTKGWELSLKEVIEVLDSRGFPIPEKFCNLSNLYMTKKETTLLSENNQIINKEQKENNKNLEINEENIKKT